MAADWRNWSNLNSDVFELISKRIGMFDYVRTQVVCKSWQLMLKESPFRHHPHNQLPWLAIPDDTSDICKFYDFIENKFRHVYLPELRDRICCGTSYGWMVVLDEKQNPFLLNPLTRSRIQLPPTTTFPEMRSIRFTVEDGSTDELDISSVGLPPVESFQGRFFTKVILSANPSVSGDYIVMGIYGAHDFLVFCRPGDKEWTLLDHACCFYSDMVYWKQHVYALQGGAHLVVYDLGDKGSVPKVITRVYKALPGSSSSYLVVSQDDELLLVARKRSSSRYLKLWGDEENSEFCSDGYQILNSEEVFDIHLDKTDGFRVFKFDEERFVWVRCTNLLEDRVLFVGKNFGLSFSIDTFPMCKANHIYFTDDYVDPCYCYLAGETKTLVAGHDLGCYDLKTDQVKPLPCFPNAASIWKIWPVPFWSTLCPY